MTASSAPPWPIAAFSARSTSFDSDGQRFRAAYFLITPDFFETMQTAFVRGRDVGPADTVSTPWVAVVNEAAAKRFWPGENPIGRRLTLDVVPEEPTTRRLGPA